MGSRPVSPTISGRNADVAERTSVWRVRRLCERPGCSHPAEVSYGIDKSRLLVWVDNRAPSERELTGRLCKRHADSLVVPRGWSLDDRREPVPLLFPAAHLVDPSGGTEQPEQRDSSRPVRRPRAEGNVLPLFDAPVTDEPVEDEPVYDEPEIDISSFDDTSPDDTSLWLQRLERRFEPAPTDDEEPTLGRLMGRAFGRPRHPGAGQ